MDRGSISVCMIHNNNEKNIYIKYTTVNKVFRYPIPDGKNPYTIAGIIDMMQNDEDLDNLFNYLENVKEEEIDPHIDLYLTMMTYINNEHSGIYAYQPLSILERKE